LIFRRLWVPNALAGKILKKPAETGQVTGNCRSQQVEFPAQKVNPVSIVLEFKMVAFRMTGISETSTGAPPFDPK
jgi:hypothetical protein